MSYMFGISELISLVISIFFILPVIVMLREIGYLCAATLLGAKNPRITLGAGPRLFKIGIFDMRRYYHLYSWFSYDSMRWNGKFSHIFLYLSPIMINVCAGVIINALLANGYLAEYDTFWNRFIFYAFYYVLFDSIPMKTLNGMPNNGMILYDLIRFGKRVDHNKTPFLPTTDGIEESYQDEMYQVDRNIREEKDRKIKMKEDKKKKTKR